MSDFQQPLRLGMVGGGQGAYIGNIHRIASRLDGSWQVVAGAFDVDPEKGRAFALSQGIEAARSYGTYLELIEGEKGREDKVDAVANLHPELHTLPDRKSAHRSGLRCDLREADHRHIGRCGRAREARARKRSLCRRDLYLCWLPDGSRSAGPRCGG